MGEILAFVSIKGGVGKTTLAIETASALANRYDKKVLLVDANFSAPNVALYLDLTNDLTLHDALSGTLLHNAIYESNGFDVVPASLYYKNEVNIFKLKQILDKFRERYDFIIIDSSPNYEELRPVIAAADKIFIVTSPDEVTLTTSLKAACAAKEQKTPVVGIIVNRIRSPKHEYNLREIEKISSIPVMAKIYDDKVMAKSTYEKMPITILNKNHHISKEIGRFASAISGEAETLTILEKVFSRVHREKVNRELYKDKFYESVFK